MNIKTDKLVAVCGPTASGKSALAIKLAQELDGEVVNIDSIQLFKGMDIGSGKVTIAERSQVKHHLLDICAPNDEVNVARFISIADEAIAEIQAKNKVAVLVGGTSLYIKSLIHGLVDAPGENSNIRCELESASSHDLRERLQKLDPESANRINYNDRNRTIRALEVIALTGKPFSELQKRHGYKESRYQCLFLVLCWPRQELHKRIDSRCQEMLSLGLVEETKNLIAVYGSSIAPLASIGYAQAKEYLAGTLRHEDLLDEIRAKTRQFAKRQLTFWRNQPSRLGWSIRPSIEEGIPLVSESGRSLRGDAIKDFNVLNLTASELVSEVSHYLVNPAFSNQAWYINANSALKS